MTTADYREATDTAYNASYDWTYDALLVGARKGGSGRRRRGGARIGVGVGVGVGVRIGCDVGFVFTGEDESGSEVEVITCSDVEVGPLRYRNC